MARPNVNITLGNGNLGRSAATDDGVAALLLTGATVRAHNSNVHSREGKK